MVYINHIRLNGLDVSSSYKCRNSTNMWQLFQFNIRTFTYGFKTVLKHVFAGVASEIENIDIRGHALQIGPLY